MAKGWFRDLLIPLKPTESAPPATSRETFFFLPLLRLYLFFFPLFCLDYFLPFDLRAVVLNGYGCYLILPAFDELLRTSVPTKLRIGSDINFRILELLFSLPSPRRYITSFDPPPFVFHGLLFSYFCLIRLSLHLSVQVFKIIYPFIKPLLKTLAIYLENKSNCSVALGHHVAVAQTVLCHTNVSGSHQCVVKKEFGAPRGGALALNNFLGNKGIISDSLKPGRAKNREEKPLVDFDATNNRACQSGLVSNSEETNAREASKGLCMTEGVLSLVGSTTRIPSTDSDAPGDSAHLVRANQSGPITLYSKEKDTSEGLIGECLTECVLSLDDSTKRKSFPDFDATEIKAHLVSAYQSGPVVSLSENKNEGEALKKDLQQHCGGRPDAAAKSFRAIYDLGLHTTDSLTRKSFQVLETLRPREQQSNATDTDQERQIQTQMCHELSDARGAHRIHLDRYIGRFRTHLCPSLCHSVCIRSIFGEQSNDLVPLLSLRRLTLKSCVRQDKSPCFPRLLQINAVDKGLTQSPRYSGGLTAQSASSSCWPIGLQDGAHIVLLDPLKQSAKNVPHAARQDQCSLTVSLREKKMVRRTLKRKYRTISVIFEYHQQYFGRRCEGAAKSFGATRNCRKHGIRQVSTVKCIHKQHWIHRWPFRQKRATRNGYSLRDERPFGGSKLSMDEKLDSRLLFIHMSQFTRSSPQPLDLLDGGVIVGPIALSSSEFAAANNRAHFVRQDQISSTASCREGKSARETLDRQGITMSLCIVDDLQQHFGGKHKDVMKRLGVNISMFNSTCRLHQFYWRPCWNEKNEQVFDARNNRTHLAKADQSGPTMSNSKKENTREALKREYVTSRVLRHLVRQRTLTHKHCVRRKKSQDLSRSL
ncbi:uncharacterized protein LOC131325763 isoform X2 [Rhododendron vialii]|uniref:uncharacterized protein LOC131325763 isoform X2 n=1 Tax=Rhododendron vialii TaxID=182163 RepID=UPI00265D6793|nr:uncharacterized protein LOC131325763 isoform X2 [Rhododendron vialii]